MGVLEHGRQNEEPSGAGYHAACKVASYEPHLSRCMGVMLCVPNKRVIFLVLKDVKLKVCRNVPGPMGRRIALQSARLGHRCDGFGFLRYEDAKANRDATTMRESKTLAKGLCQTC